MTQRSSVSAEVPEPFVELLDKAYRLLPAERPADLETCTCCVDEHVAATFFEYAPRELPTHYLYEWFEGAVDPDGVSQDLWRWLLPRVFEALVKGEEPVFTDPALALSRFATGDRTRWTPKEWAVLDGFREAFIAHGPALIDDSLDTVLCMFASAGWPLRDLFAATLALDDEQLVTSAEYPAWNGSATFFPTPFWSDAQVELARRFIGDELPNRLYEIAENPGCNPDLMTRAIEAAVRYADPKAQLDVTDPDDWPRMMCDQASSASTSRGPTTPG